jgi:8-oxo-dGTP pyrophosphatase MutT (NUDIX family)
VNVVEKVTAFVTRRSGGAHELLLLEHPYAGVQIPAGTVEVDETPEAAVMREAAEESGLAPLLMQGYVGWEEEELPEDARIVCQATKVYARPDVTSFDWSRLPRGTWVTVGRRAEGVTQVTYEEWDRLPDPQYLSMVITGWVPDGALAAVQRRHFFHLAFDGETAARWTVHTDNHAYTLFWAPLTDLPEIIHPQDEWLAFLPPELRPAQGESDALRY